MNTTQSLFNNLEIKECYDLLDNFLHTKGWIKSGPYPNFFYKKENSYRTNLNFRDIPARKKGYPICGLLEKTNRFFSRTHTSIVSNDIISENALDDSFFIVAGVQLFSEIFWSDRDTTNVKKYILLQPSIRMKSLKNISPGCLSSFVNLCTVSLECDYKMHLSALNSWITYFSELGLFAADFILENVPYEMYGINQNGKWSETKGLNLKIRYLDFEIGDAGFIKVPRKSGLMSISDIGFGFERLLWCLNSRKEFITLIAPEIESKKNRLELVDSIRTATLILMSNYSEKNINVKNQLRKLSKISARDYGNYDTFKLIEYFYKYWSMFINPKNNLFQIYRILDEKISKELKGI